MGYSIHIERCASGAHHRPIELSEWRSVVERTDGVRMAQGDWQIANPKTGEVIRIGDAGGDADVYFPSDAAWRRIFMWSPEGSIEFRAPGDFLMPDSPMRRLATALARDLDANLVGDEGEIYE